MKRARMTVGLAVMILAGAGDEIGVAGGGPGGRAGNDSNGAITSIVLADLDPPAGEGLATKLYGALAERERRAPDEVMQFVERRDLCDHFRGEEPYDEERRRFLVEQIRETCTGRDGELARLLEKYRRNAAVLDLLRNAEVLDCRFIPVEFAEDEIPGCAYVDLAGRLVLLPETIAAVEKRGSQPVAAVVGSTLHYLNSAGRAAPVLWYDNGADYFAEGLARTVRGGKIGFIDRDLSEKIAPTWDFAFPFKDGVALVCQGCRAHPVGEHKEMRGGLWGYIDREGGVVVPVECEREELPPPPTKPG